MTARADNAGRRLAFLDGLRGLAALVVAIFYHYVHFSARFDPGGVAESLAPLYDIQVVQLIYRRGYLGVDLFFIISGFIFSHVYADDLAARRVGGWAFFVRRLARLYPLHLLTLLVTAVLVLTFEFATGRPPIYAFNGTREFILNLLFLQNGTLERGASFNGPAWSLSVEAGAYLLFFVLALAGMRLRPVAVLLLVGVSLALLAPNWPWRPLGVSSQVGRGLAGFFLGVLLHRLGRRRPLPLACALGLVPVAAWVAVPHLPRPDMAWSLALAWSGFGLLILALDRVPALRWPLECAPVRRLGDMSLAIYMVHVPVQVAILWLMLWLDRPAPYASPLFQLAYTLAVLGIAWLAHRGVELPAQRHLRRRLDRATASPTQIDRSP